MIEFLIGGETLIILRVGDAKPLRRLGQPEALGVVVINAWPEPSLSAHRMCLWKCRREELSAQVFS